MTPWIKICCINSIKEAELAIQYGASAIGLVGHMPSGPGVIADDLINEIASKIPPPIGTFLLTSETSADSIIAHHQKTYTNTIQMVDRPVDGSYDQIRNAMPAIKLVQVIHVIDKNSVDEAIEVAGKVDALLLDSGNPKAAVKELGGTGRIHDWKLSRKIRDSVNIPVFLAGGLNSGNVKQALEAVRPFGVDVCSGVRTNGKLDELKLKAFVELVTKG
ncbi:MAG: phosphoribosylanthranilate isomerase [Bacteroidales bacterium]|nr:phosphoribosylanthranilate isomerase [Bacteroidales bacterium]